jgi:putative FmdB family regulatory protein
VPIYEYKCENGHHFEVVQRMTDDPVAICEVCGEPVERVFRPVAVHFKGSGFYTTDYARKGKGSSDSSKDAAKESKPSESKSAGEGQSSKPGETAKAGSGSSD